MLAAGAIPVIRAFPDMAAGDPTTRRMPLRTDSLGSRAMDKQSRTAVVLADDHIVVRRGLRMLLEQAPGLAVVGEAGDARSALDATAAERADILVLDLNMPGEPPLETLPRVAESAPGAAVVVLTMERDPALARRALELGAKGYVLKEAVDEELVACLLYTSDAADDLLCVDL